MSEDYHEPQNELSPETRDVHRALATLIEELEAVDWYHQRIDRTDDHQLKAVLVHNRDEEIEHAVMTLEWLRRRMPTFDENLRTYLFTTAPITEIEEHEERSPEPEPRDGEASTRNDLGIGSLRKEG